MENGKKVTGGRKNVDLLRIMPEEIEPICRYTFLKNDKDELLLRIPGYFKGEAREAKLFYNGGKHAILARGVHSCLLCDSIHPDVRGTLLSSNKLVVCEDDAKRFYLASVVREDIDTLAREAQELHNYYYEYHPFPLMDGTFCIGDGVCDYCSKKMRIYYKGIVNSGKTRTICPVCIEQWQPARHGELLYPDIDDDCFEVENNEEVYGNTPPFYGAGSVPSIWGIHCDALGVYLGKLEPEDLNVELRETIIKNWRNKKNIYSGENPAIMMRKLLTGELKKELHLFRCAKCGEVYGIFI